MDLAPGVRTALKALLEKENGSSEKTKVTLTYTDVINQALAKLDDGQNIFYIDFGSQLIEADGSIAPVYSMRKAPRAA